MKKDLTLGLLILTGAIAVFYFVMSSQNINVFAGVLFVVSLVILFRNFLFKKVPNFKYEISLGLLFALIILFFLIPSSRIEQNSNSSSTISNTSTASELKFIGYELDKNPYAYFYKNKII